MAARDRIRRLGTAVAIDQPEAPFFDEAVVLVERISPSEHHGPGQAVIERFFELPVDKVRLPLAPVAETALAELSQHEGQLAGQMLQA